MSVLLQTYVHVPLHIITQQALDIQKKKSINVNNNEVWVFSPALKEDAGLVITLK